MSNPPPPKHGNYNKYDNKGKYGSNINEPEPRPNYPRSHSRHEPHRSDDYRYDGPRPFLPTPEIPPHVNPRYEPKEHKEYGKYPGDFYPYQSDVPAKRLYDSGPGAVGREGPLYPPRNKWPKEHVQPNRFRDQFPDPSRFLEQPPDANRFREQPPDSNRFRDQPPDSSRFRDQPPGSKRLRDQPRGSNRLKGQFDSNRPRAVSPKVKRFHGEDNKKRKFEDDRREGTDRNKSVGKKISKVSGGAAIGERKKMDDTMHAKSFRNVEGLGSDFDKRENNASRQKLYERPPHKEKEKEASAEITTQSAKGEVKSSGKSNMEVEESSKESYIERGECESDGVKAKTGSVQRKEPTYDSIQPYTGEYNLCSDSVLEYLVVFIQLLTCIASNGQKNAI